MRGRFFPKIQTVDNRRGHHTPAEHHPPLWSADQCPYAQAVNQHPVSDVAVVEPAAYVAVSACDTDIVDVPTPWIDTVLPEMVATELSLLV